MGYTDVDALRVRDMLHEISHGTGRYVDKLTAFRELITHEEYKSEEGIYKIIDKNCGKAMDDYFKKRRRIHY